MPPPTLPKPKFPKQIEIDLENSLPDTECKMTPSMDQKRVIMATSSEHIETSRTYLAKVLIKENNAIYGLYEVFFTGSSRKFTTAKKNL